MTSFHVAIEHNHELDKGSVEVAKTCTNIYQQAKSTRGNTSHIVANSLESMTQEGRLSIGKECYRRTSS